MKSKKNLSFWAIFLLTAAVLSGLSTPAIFAALQGKDLDLFTSEMAYAPSHRSLSKQIASDFLTYPFALVRWPLNSVVDFVEDRRIPKKVRFVLEKLEDHGIIPELGFQTIGAEINFPKLTNTENFLPPNFMTKGWVYYSPDLTFKTGLKTGFEPEDASGFHAFAAADYEKRPEEFFYGIGPGTSAGEGSTYKMETTTLEARSGYTLENSWRWDNKLAYRNINIYDGDKKGRGVIQNIFDPHTIPGLHGDEIVTVGTEFSWEPERGHSRRLSTTPGKASFGFEYNEGIDKSDARYLKFTTELIKSVNLGSPRRTFAAKFYGEHNNSFNGGETPFHQMPRLGGFGGFPENSHTMRGYVRGRFTDESAVLANLEYRYWIYEYRNWVISHAFFLDEGQAFKKFSRFQIKDFKESYGTGFRVGYQERVIFDFEVAHANEGTLFYFKNRQPF